MKIQAQDVMFTFQKGANGERWTLVNDGVMGGRSRASFTLSKNYGHLEGTISLDNSGGFSSIRSSLDDYDWSDYDGLVVRVRGDGRTYNMVFRQTQQWQGLSYYYFFATRPGVWMDVVVPFDKCKAHFFGRSAWILGALAPGKIKQVGVMLFDKKEGPFVMDVAWIKGYKNPEEIDLKGMP